jgi:hypothetical protein
VVDKKTIGKKGDKIGDKKSQDKGKNSLKDEHFRKLSK